MPGSRILRNQQLDDQIVMSPPISIPELMTSMDESSGEGEFLRQLTANYRYMYSCALTIVGNAEDADDVMQEVCVVLWQKYGTGEFEQILHFRKWACSIVFNLAKLHVRKQRRHLRAGLSEQILRQIIQAHSAGSELFELRREILQECLGKMPVSDRSFIFDCYQDSLPLGKIARARGSTVAAVYSKLKRLRRMLSDCMKRRLGMGEDW